MLHLTLTQHSVEVLDFNVIQILREINFGALASQAVLFRWG